MTQSRINVVWPIPKRFASSLRMFRAFSGIRKFTWIMVEADLEALTSTGSVCPRNSKGSCSSKNWAISSSLHLSSSCKRLLFALVPIGSLLSILSHRGEEASQQNIVDAALVPIIERIVVVIDRLRLLSGFGFAQPCLILILVPYIIPHPAPIDHWLITGGLRAFKTLANRA